MILMNLDFKTATLQSIRFYGLKFAVLHMIARLQTP